MIAQVPIQPVEITKDVLLAGALFVIALGVAVVLVLLALHRTDRELEVGIKPARFGTHPRAAADRHTEKMYNAALARLADLEQAIVAITTADAADVEAVYRDWLDFVLEGLASVLGAYNNAHFRIAIWTDDETDKDYIKGFAWFGFDRNNPKYSKLPRATTLAGWVIANQEDHYCMDVNTCTLYRPRTNPPRYKSMYAAPLGEQGNPWAAITVDAPAVDGLSEERRALIRRFGSLATVGSAIAGARMTGTGTTGS